MAAIAARHTGNAATAPLLDYPPYRSSALRHPKQPTFTYRGQRRRCSWRTGTRRGEQPVAAGRPAGRRAPVRSGAAAVDGRGGVGWWAAPTAGDGSLPTWSLWPARRSAS
ncbi:hypothetical protein H7I03_04765 [Mycobacterium sherrisii]|nr:hypothetical protein [Mycobacterium sherrisii]